MVTHGMSKRDGDFIAASREAVLMGVGQGKRGENSGWIQHIPKVVCKLGRAQPCLPKSTFLANLPAPWTIPSMIPATVNTPPMMAHVVVTK